MGVEGIEDTRQRRLDAWPYLTQLRDIVRGDACEGEPVLVVRKIITHKATPYSRNWVISNRAGLTKIYRGAKSHKIDVGIWLFYPFTAICCFVSRQKC